MAMARLTRTPGSERRDRVVAMWNAGVRTADIAKTLGITQQRVYQHLKRAGQVGEIEYPPREGAA